MNMYTYLEHVISCYFGIVPGVAVEVVVSSVSWARDPKQRPISTYNLVWV